MSAAAFFFLMALIPGQGDAAAFATLGVFHDQPACSKAQGKIVAALKDAQSPGKIFCVSSDDLAGLGAAAKGAD